eukprot:scaffold23211_cov100-Skeletonema_marinoi.AAC.4
MTRDDYKIIGFYPFLGWEVLLEVAVMVTSIVIASVRMIILTQRAALQLQVDELTHPKSRGFARGNSGVSSIDILGRG